MSGPRKLLISGGLALIIWGMSYGLWFAVFDEHQTLERMGVSLATAFAKAAERKLPEANAALQDYAATRFEYVREVDVHSHWSGLAMLLILLGVVLDRVGYDERKRRGLAALLLTGAVIFPLGVIFQTFDRGPVPQAMAIAGTVMLIAALTLVAAGFLRRRE